MRQLRFTVAPVTFLFILLPYTAQRADAQTQATVTEAELLVRQARPSQGRVIRIAGQFSGGAVLAWGNAQPQARLELPIQTSNAGQYRIAIAVFESVDQGSFSVGLQGQQLNRFDAFGFQPTIKRVELGSANLTAGTNWLIFVLDGKAARSRGYSLGIDRIELTRVATRPPSTTTIPRPSTSRPPSIETPRPLTTEPESGFRVVYRDRQVLPATHAERLRVSVERMDDFVSKIPTAASWQTFFELDSLLDVAKQQSADAAARETLQRVHDRFATLDGQTQYEGMTKSDEAVSLRTSVEGYLTLFPKSLSPIATDDPHTTMWTMPTTTLGYRPLDRVLVHVGLLDEFGGPDLKVWNGMTGDFRAYVNEVSIAYGRNEANAWQFRWLNKSDKVKRAVWQVTALNPGLAESDDWQNPSGMVASGELNEVPAVDQFGYFEIDFVTLTGWKAKAKPADLDEDRSNQGVSLQRGDNLGAHLSNLKVDTFNFATRAQLVTPLLNRLDKRTFFVRLATLDQEGTLVDHPSLAVLVHFVHPEQPDLNLGQDLSLPPQGPRVKNPPQVWVDRFEPIYSPPDRDCWLITDKNWHKWKVGTKVCKPIEKMYHKSKRQKLKETLKNAPKLVVDAVNWVSDAWDSIQNEVVGTICKRNNRCENLLGAGLDYGLVTLGVPPEFPDFDELCEMGKGRLADLIQQGAIEMIPASGLPETITRDLITEEVAQQMADKTVEEIKKVSQRSKDKKDWFRLHPDAMDKDAWIIVAIHNPGLSECTGELSIRSANRLFAARYRIPIPRMRPGETIRFPVTLRPDYEAYNKHETQLMDENLSRATRRWWDIYVNDPPDFGIRLHLEGHTPNGSTDDEPNTPFVTNNDSFVHPLKESYQR